LPALTDGQQVLFTFDDEFPKDQRKPAAERVLAARTREKTASVVVPNGMQVHVRERAGLPWQPVEPPRRRGRPRAPIAPPPDGRGFEWSDDAARILGKEVWKIVRNRDDNRHDTDRRQFDDGTIIGRLHTLAATFLGRPLTASERARLKTLFGGGPSRRRQDDRDRRQAKASAIALELIMWKGGIGERDVTTYKKTRAAGKRPALDFLRYR
jgi:hypothetical protein